MKIKQPRYHRHSIVPIEMGLSVVRNGEGRALLNGMSVNISSLRLQTFAVKGVTCVSCGLSASFFALERSWNDRDKSPVNKPFHMNLWAVKDEKEILFTHDHILARCLGGKDKITNTQPMCENCNYKKSILEHRELERRKKEKEHGTL